MNNWYVEVRTKQRPPARDEARGSSVKVRYDYDKLVAHRLNLAIEEAHSEGVKVTPALEARWLKSIQTEVTAFLLRKGQL